MNYKLATSRLGIVILVMWFGYWMYQYYELTHDMHIFPCENREAVPPELGCHYYDTALAERNKVLPYAIFGAAIGGAIWFAATWVINGLSVKRS